MRWHAALLGLFVGTATAACSFLLDFEELQKEQGVAAGGSGGAGGADADADAMVPIPIGEAAQKFAEAICARFEECMPGATALLYGDVPCVEYTKRRLADGMLAGLDQLPPDTAEYHAELAPACVAALRGTGDQTKCPEALDWPVECDKAVEGKVLEGKGCVHPAQCAPGLYCDLTTACPGTCTKKLGSDAACVEGVCQEGLQCEEFKTLKASLCKAPVATPGAPCGGDTLPRCAVGMLCVGISFDQDAGADAGASPGKCKAAQSVFGFGNGADCNWSNGDLCQPSLHCKLSDTVGNGKCIPTALLDEPCGLAIPDMCPAGQYCKPNVYQPPQVSLAGSCTNLPGVDEPCALDAIYNEDCKAGTRCVAGVCKALIPIDAVNPVQCKDNEVCYSGLCNNVCVPPIHCTQ